MTTTDRIKLLLELGEADRGRDWPDHLQYGFVETDVPALLDLVADEALDQASSDSAEVWAPVLRKYSCSFWYQFVFVM